MPGCSRTERGRILRLEKDMVDKKVSENIASKTSWGLKKKVEAPSVSLWEALEYKVNYFETSQRYEAQIERGMYKALHELQRLQAARTGGSVPLPGVVDVDISGQDELPGKD